MPASVAVTVQVDRTGRQEKDGSRTGLLQTTNRPGKGFWDDDETEAGPRCY